MNISQERLSSPFYSQTPQKDPVTTISLFQLWVFLASFLFLYLWGCPLLLLTVLVISSKHNECHRIGDINNKHVFLTVLETRKPKVKVLVDVVSGEHSIPSLQMAAFLPLSHMAKEEIISFKSLLIRVLISIMRAPPSWPQ